MRQESTLDTLLFCGVPVLQWRGVTGETVLRRSQRVLHTLVQHGYREAVIDLRRAITIGSEGYARLLQEIERELPAGLHVEVVLPAGETPDTSCARLHVATSVAAALSHLARVPIASLQGSSNWRIRCKPITDEE